ncbi:cupredoxin domain-containing protein [Streptomyces sp. NBC_00190]|uniref:cupredoxin domain-containing protein n=1 Tax=unclassified Streptomyces TaxID=2593676 RepID=UPI002E2DD067|nr:cupredoxin domain-containing protein [Streptomyces sp. NBC_00190]WSZ44612.1 cupredoxin domain-containing protein [Streptomyces sp. NBC_00868]
MTTTLTRPRARRRVALGLAAGALASVLAACGDGNGGGGGTSTAKPPEPAKEAGVTQVTADLTDFRIALSQQTFKAGDYSFAVKNSGQHDHALEIEGPTDEKATKTLEPGASETLKVTLASGTYEIYCPVDGHKDKGMKTEITVAGGSEAPVNQTPSSSDGY